MITYSRDLMVTAGGMPPVIRISQYSDDFSVIFYLKDGEGFFTLESGTTAEIRGTKTDGNGYSADAAIDITNKTVTVAGHKQMTAVEGENIFEIVLWKGEKELATANFILLVEPAAMDAETVPSESVIKEVDEAVDEYFATHDIVIDQTLLVAGRPADAKATGDALRDADIYDLRTLMNHYSSDWNGIKFTWDGEACSIIGTATAVTYNNIYISTNTLPQGIHAGDVLRVKYSAQKVSLIFYDYSGGNIRLIKEVKRDAIVKIPDTCTGLIVRLWIANGTTVNESVRPRIYINSSYLIESVDTASQDESGKTDMKFIIQEMLDIYGYCKLGTGVYYISGSVAMSEGSTLEGCGEATEIRLLSGNGKAAILMKKYCTVHDLAVIGSYTDLAQSSFGETSGTRYGIQYYKGGSDTYSTAYCSITNVHIRNFTGAGIYQYGTGANVEQGLFVSNVHIKNCWCGIWIYANSEFCRYSNVQITYCYIACINNGGNNAFDNCVFHAYSIGMKIDGTQNNSAHGMCSNSSFCHTGGNVGSALTLDNIVNGFVFAACQFWYNSIDIVNCGGIVFSGCEFGRGTTGKGATINITGGNTVMFGGCVFMNDVAYEPVITITDNDKVKFNGCYGSVSGDPVGA